MNNLLEQARESLDVTYAIASYDREGDAINIHAVCGNCRRDVTETSCGEVINSIRSVVLLVNGAAPAGSSVFSTFFEQNGYLNVDEPKNWRTNIILIAVSLRRGSAAVHCEASHWHGIPPQTSIA